MAHAPWDDAADGDNVLPFEAWRSELVYRNDGVTLEPKRAANFRVMLTHHGAIEGKLRLNLFSGKIEVGQTPWNRRGPTRPLEDLDAARAREWLQGLGLQPSKDEVRDAISAAAAAQAYHPVREYLTGLHWDGTERLAHWLHDLLGVDDTAYARAIGPKVLIGAVARVMKPGSKVDNVLILEGGQGSGKSSAIAALFGRDYTLESVDLFGDHKRLVMATSGKWAVEIAEFAAVRASNSERVKGLLSAVVDTVTMNYARVATDHPRQFIFIGTVNPDGTGYLADSTGNRRYWPVCVGDIDLKAIAAIRDQLWAEALTRFRAGERWWLDPGETVEAVAEQSEREESHPWDDVLADKLAGWAFVTANGALAELGVPVFQRTRSAQMTVAGCLKRLGFKRGHNTAGTARGWKR